MNKFANKCTSFKSYIMNREKQLEKRVCRA